MPQYQNNTHLPPINYSQLPPAGQNYMPQQYRNELPRYTSAPSNAPVPSPTPDNRYNSQMNPQGSMGALPPTSMLPSPHQQPQQQPPQQQQQSHQAYHQQPPPRQTYPQPLAPAPPRPNIDSIAQGYPHPDNRQQPWSGAESMPGMTTDVGRDPTRTHVVGSQGRRGILPSAPGRPPVMPNGVNGSPKSNAVPQKDADGKFPCPNCTKTYLHAKHLKRHMLRHTGDRPYMCVLCNDTFSRSDILKRHFQKCSVRRGNPTGASHLSNPAAHLKKSQQAAAKAAAAAGNSPANASTPTSGVMNNPPYTTASMPSTSAPTTTAPAPGMAYGMSSNGQGDMQRQGQMQPGSAPAGMDPNGNASWSMHDARNSQMMYQTSTPPTHYGMQPGGGDDKRNVMQAGAHHIGDEWNHMFHPSGNEGYMNPMFGGYDQSQGDVKKDYESHEGGSNGYYIPSTSLGADGTLGPPLWNLHASRQDLLQAKVNALLTFVFPGGIQESLQEHQNNLSIQSCLTVDNIQHYLDLFPHFQGHFPWLHVPTFDFLNSYDGLVLVIICSGAVYSDRTSQNQVRALMQRVKQGIERTSKILQNLELGIPQSQFSPSGIEFQELQALTILQGLFVWHGGPEDRALARAESKRIMYLVRQFDMLTLVGPEDTVGHSYLHSLQPGEEADPSRWDWRSWVEQEKRSRLMFMVFLWDAAMCIYFNVAPQFSSAEIKLPLPCDDAAWEAQDAETCAQALGLRGHAAQSRVNATGSHRLKQLEMHHAMSALHSTSVLMHSRTTNIYSKFILIHALHAEIWQVQRQLSFINSTGSPGSGENSAMDQSMSMYNSIDLALARWKHSWDQDLALQYPPNDGYHQSSKRVGFCRDGIHFYWLARAFLRPDRTHDWQLPADTRLQQTLHGLKKARDWSRSDSAQRGEEPGSVACIDDNYALASPVLDMRRLFRPLRMISDDSLASSQHL
ncbi:hypothetical protein LTR99_000360 [Exophiala xenobiotica]|nr:hypothetical protein LTR47_000831 [Exophiala xenobiotica]KAK5307389.1 hypothetical protein LTR99_000360 [Exophiala xenobiotica]KAK5324165.1 hypothetical protein LTR93_004952 [Exophiala xenobiotica]KAK5355491.1 hypothetical protein LTR61_001163 [Exophiala xenobiotica]KAK5386457.1 hypothetical protein LTS03_001730 [Exophiala xenobiotica]